MTRAPGTFVRTTAVRRVIQGLVLAVACIFIWRFAVRHQTDLGRVQWHLSPLPLVGASVVWALSFGGLVVLWSRSLRWWETGMRASAALRVFFLSNLARYVPGAVWQFAGLAAMSAAQGVPPVAATAAVLWQQVALLGTGAALALGLAPVVLEPLFKRWGLGVPTLGVRLAIAGLVSVAAILVLPRLLAPLRSFLERRAPDVRAIPHVTTRQLASYLALSAAGWIGYAISFALFARAVLGDAAPPGVEAGAIYIAAYVLGILAFMMPGGLGVREGALAVALAPLIGADRAIFLSIASRLWLVALEVVGAVGFLVARGGKATVPAAPDVER